MVQIRPVSDLRNKFSDIEKAVGGGEPIFLTKNGYGAMEDDRRYAHEEVFSNLRRRANG